MDSLFSKLVDDIYEAPFRPEKWYSALDLVAKLVQAEGTLLCNTTDPSLPWIATQGVSDLYSAFFEEGWAYDNPRSQALLTIPHAGFLSDAEHLDEDWMAKQAVYRDFLWPRGFGYASGTVIESPSDAVLAISIERKRASGPFGHRELLLLDQLRPHLARAAVLAGHLEFTRIEGAMQALQLADVPAATIRIDGKMLQANEIFHRSAQGIFIAAGDRLVFRNPSAQAFYQTMLRQPRKSIRESKTFPLPSTDENPPALLHIVPITGSAREIFTGAAFFLFVVPIRADAVPGPEIIKGLFDLTAAEANVAAKLVSGKRVADIATGSGLSPETVRSQVKSILAKSGMTSQRDFVSAVASLRTTRG